MHPSTPVLVIGMGCQQYPRNVSTEKIPTTNELALLVPPRGIHHLSRMFRPPRRVLPVWSDIVCQRQVVPYSSTPICGEGGWFLFWSFPQALAPLFFDRISFPWECPLELFAFWVAVAAEVDKEPYVVVLWVAAGHTYLLLPFLVV